MEATIRRATSAILDKRYALEQERLGCLDGGPGGHGAFVRWWLSHRGTSFDTYHLAGSHWLHGENVYSQWMGFVYSPVVAAFFAPFAYLPSSLANILWRVLNAALLLGGLAAILKTNLFAGIKERNYGLLYILLVPLAVGNIDISQANPLVEGLLLLAIAAVYAERWNSAALCVAIATCFKIYPIAVGLLICVIAPRRFSWADVDRSSAAPSDPIRFPALVLCFEINIRPGLRRERRMIDASWPIEKLPLDLWFLIHWVWHLPISPKIYSLIQLGTAGALALFCAVADLERLGKKSHFDRSVLPGLDLDDSLRTGYGILYVFDSGAGRHSGAGPGV